MRKISGILIANIINANSLTDVMETITILKKEYLNLKRKALALDKIEDEKPDPQLIKRLRKRAAQFEENVRRGKVYTREQIGI